MVGVVEGWEVEEGFGTDAGALTARAGSVLMKHPEGQCLCSEAQWDRQEVAEAISALHGVCFSMLNSGLCLPASLLGAVPALSCCAFCLQLLLAAHPQSASPAALWKGGNRSMLVKFSGAAAHWHGEGENAALAVQ